MQEHLRCPPRPHWVTSYYGGHVRILYIYTFYQLLISRALVEVLYYENILLLVAMLFSLVILKQTFLKILWHISRISN